MRSVCGGDEWRLRGIQDLAEARPNKGRRFVKLEEIVVGKVADGLATRSQRSVSLDIPNEIVSASRLGGRHCICLQDRAVSI